MTVQLSPYELIRAIQDQQRATDRLVQILAGMLDKSQPEPLLSFQPSLVPAAPAAPTRKLRRVSGAAGRPPAEFDLEGVTISTTERRAKILRAVQERPLGLSDMVRRGFAPRNNAMMAQIADINADLEKSGSTFQIKAQPRPPRKTGRGSVAPVYDLVDITKIATPVVLTAAQSEAAAGSIPEQGADESAAGDGAVISAQSAQFVTPTGEGEDRPGSADPLPVADDEPLKPERLAAVDVTRLCVFGPLGHVFVNARAARALHVLKDGDLFGLDHVAKRANVPSTSDCKHALRVEEAALKSIGLEIWCDKFNVRLREAS